MSEQANNQAKEEVNTNMGAPDQLPMPPESFKEGKIKFLKQKEKPQKIDAESVEMITPNQPGNGIFRDEGKF